MALTPAGKSYAKTGLATLHGDAAGPYFGLSTDTLPDRPPNGTIVYFMDTKVAKMYDAENNQWREQ